jgi:hypothetical protein
MMQLQEDEIRNAEMTIWESNTNNPSQSSIIPPPPPSSPPPLYLLSF